MIPSEPPVVLVEPIDAPAPSAELEALLRHAAPLRPRDPRREALWIIGGLAAWALLVVALIGLRGDLPALPSLRFFAGGLAWCAVALTAIVVATRPAPGQVLPSVRAARLLVILLPWLAAAMAAALLLDAPSLTRHPTEGEAGKLIAHCLGLGLGVAVVPLLVVLAQARRRLLAGRAWIGAAVGVATGALGALVLHVVCPTGGVAHVLGGHAGALVVAALVGAIVVRLLPR